MFFKALFVTQVLFELFNCRANGNAALGSLDSKGENATVEDTLFYSDVANGYFSFLVSINRKQVGNNTGEDICPGILINPSTVLTSYCASNNTKDLQIVLKDKNSEIIRNVSRITLHPHHGLNNQSDIKEVVLITLDIPIYGTEIIEIGQNLTKSMVSNGTNCNAIATYNVSDHGSGNFLSYNMSLIDWNECKSKLNGASLNEWEHVCAKLNYPENICLADGSPLICEGKVLGYRPLSKASPQCSNDLIVFVRLDSIKDILISKEKISSSNASDVKSANPSPIKPQDNNTTMKGPKCWSESENSTACDSPLNKSQEIFPVQNETDSLEKIAKMKRSKDLYAIERSSSDKGCAESNKAFFTCSPSSTTSLVLVYSLITRLGVLFK